MSNVVLTDLGDIRTVWEAIFDEPLNLSAKIRRTKPAGEPDPLLVELDRLRDITDGLIVNLPPGDDWDVATSWSAVWFYGRCEPDLFKVRWEDEYPCRFCWVVSLRVARVPMVFVRKSFFRKLHSEREGHRPLDAKELKRIVPKSANAHPDYCWAWPQWDMGLWKSKKPKIANPRTGETRGLFSGEFMPPTIVFQPVLGTDLLCSPLVPTKVPDDILRVRVWGMFKEAELQFFVANGDKLREKLSKQAPEPESDLKIPGLPVV
jgi:hypothetical protein